MIVYQAKMTHRKSQIAFMAERSKANDSSSFVLVLVGSNPTECISYIFADVGGTLEIYSRSCVEAFLTPYRRSIKLHKKGCMTTNQIR